MENRSRSEAITINGNGSVVNGHADLHGESFTGSPVCGFSYVQDSNGSFNQDSRTEDDSSTQGTVTPSPIDLMPGEQIEEEADFSGSKLMLTNYRLCISSLSDSTIAVIPLMTIESLDFKEAGLITIVSKEGRVYRISCASNETAVHWHRRLMKCTSRDSVSEAFAWQFALSIKKRGSCDWFDTTYLEDDLCGKEWKRLDYDPDHFQIFDGNKDYEVIETYPSRLILPRKMTPEEIKSAREFRFLQRMPSVTWKCKETRAVLLRSSQPKQGFLSWRSREDEMILDCVNKYMQAYSTDAPTKTIILDARSYTAAYFNKAKGGGFEIADYYANTETQFLGLPNIHNVRYAFVQLRTILTSVVEPTTYLQSIQATNWIQYLSSLLFSSVRCADILFNGQSVLVHCSDGWDRTSQLVALAKLIGDEYYRTIKGFEELVRRDWIEFGHKFADRNGVYGSDTNERSPVFMQFLDAVRVLLKSNPTSFEFNEAFLLKLAQHMYSGLFGSFLFNCMSDAKKERQREDRPLNVEPISIWCYLSPGNNEIVNELYDYEKKGKLTQLDVGVDSIDVWKDCYCSDSLPGNIPFVEPVTPQNAPLHPGSPQPATSPPRDPLTVPKSKSSESINSLGTQLDGSLAQSGLNGLHSESNGQINSVGAEHGSMEDSIMSESVCHLSRSRPKSVYFKSMKEILDNDGLVRIIDPAQDRLKFLIKQFKSQLREKDEQLAVVLRQRSLSEKTSHSGMSRDDRLASVGEYDIDMENMSIGRAASDMSLVEPEGPSTGGWSTSQSHCQICEKLFSKLSFKTAERPHHCRNCGKAVCEACSPHVYHEPHEGKSELKRACRICYPKMGAVVNGEAVLENGLGDQFNSPDEDVPPSDATRNRTDTMLPNRSSFRNNCASQAVKG